MWPFSAPCPVDDKSRDWIDQRMKWLADQFGMTRWRLGRAIEPTDEFFPDCCDGSEPQVRMMLDRVSGFMDIPSDRVELQLHSSGSPARIAARQPASSATRAPHLTREKEIVAVDSSRTGDPMVLVALLARELALVRLLGEDRLTGEEPDIEPLTDLTAIFFGLGIFSANSRFRFSQWTTGHWSGWRASRLGSLDERMFGYALGLWATGRHETNPRWTHHLMINPRSFMKQAQRYLRSHPPVWCL